MSTSWDIDYTLVIEFERCTVQDMRGILKCLHSGSTLCYPDIYYLADIVIYNMEKLGHGVRDPKYDGFVQLIKEMRIVLLSINGKKGPTERIIAIEAYINLYLMNMKSPEVSPVASPQVEGGAKGPKIMKKLFKKKD